MSSLHRKVNEFKTLYNALHTLYISETVSVTLTPVQARTKAYNHNMFGYDELFNILIHPIDFDIIMVIYLRYLDQNSIVLNVAENNELQKQVLDNFLKNVKYHSRTLVMRIQEHYTRLKAEGNYHE